MFSKKATKIDKIFTVTDVLCSECQINGEDLTLWGECKINSEDLTLCSKSAAACTL